jgi:hypothetical protein
VRSFEVVHLVRRRMKKAAEEAASSLPLGSQIGPGPEAETLWHCVSRLVAASPS